MLIKHSLATIFKTFHEILCSSIFLSSSCCEIGQDQRKVINLTILVLLECPMLKIKCQDHKAIDSGEEDFKCINHEQVLDHVGHVTWTM